MGDHTAPPAKQPQPVLTRAGIVTAISVLAALLVHVGAGDVAAWLDQWKDLIAGGLLVVGPLVTALLARRHVTPSSSPKTSAGVDLVPKSSADHLVDVAAVLAAAEEIFPAPSRAT